jgi:hypothetical protein
VICDAFKRTPEIIRHQTKPGPSEGLLVTVADAVTTAAVIIIPINRGGGVKA